MQKIFSEFYSPSLRSDLKTFRLDGARWSGAHIHHPQQKVMIC